MNQNDNRMEAHQLVDHIFKDLLPQHGMVQRPAQIQLSHEMLDAMLREKIALCDAGTGIGKTFSYLVAAAAAALRTETICRPILISTSSIALQNAVQTEYLPLLSHVLQEDGIIEHPLQALIRKGKRHYVCDRRLHRRLRQVEGTKKNSKAAAALCSLREHLDLDHSLHLSGYDRARVCVPQVCDCAYQSCRYRGFLEHCDESQTLFQICNHNLLMADAIHRSSGKRPILPEHSIVIVDEAHKLPEAAREMFGVTLCAGEIRALIRQLKTERYLLAAEALSETAGNLLCKLERPWDETEPLEALLRCVAAPTRALLVIRQQIRNQLTPSGRRQLDALCSKTAFFHEAQPEMLFYTAEDPAGGTMLCATVSDLTNRMRDTLWAPGGAYILASGTLAVGTDFSRFKTQAGLQDNWRVVESVSPSPFDYRANCLLYLPQLPPQFGPEAYYDDATDEIAGLLTAASGHALVLFTSYAAMSAVKIRLQERKLPYPMFTLGRNAPPVMERFRKTPGAVLLATGAAWEGFDFPGDCVSLLIIPRLPFAFPDALKEKEREEYDSLRQFIQSVAVPEMQIKLRQGFGRAIRTENDTCVVAVLDERAGRRRRYFAAVQEALPEMRITGSLREITKFLKERKTESYFEVCAEWM